MSDSPRMHRCLAFAAHVSGIVSVICCMTICFVGFRGWMDDAMTPLSMVAGAVGAMAPTGAAYLRDRAIRRAYQRTISRLPNYEITPFTERMVKEVLEIEMGKIDE